MKTKEIWYSIQNGGDGSAYPQWFESKKLAEIDQEYMDEGWGEPCIGCITVESESDIYIQEEIKTKESWIKEIEDDILKGWDSDEDKQKLKALKEL